MNEIQPELQHSNVIIFAAFPASIKKVLFENNFGNVHFFRIDMMKRIAIDCLLRIVYEHMSNVGIA